MEIVYILARLDVIFASSPQRLVLPSPRESHLSGNGVGIDSEKA